MRRVGVYNEVRIGYTLLEDGKPLWSVDVHLGLDDAPVVVGNGRTLADAAKAAQRNTDKILRASAALATAT